MQVTLNPLYMYTWSLEIYMDFETKLRGTRVYSYVLPQPGNIKPCLTAFLGHASNKHPIGSDRTLGGSVWLEIDDQVTSLPSPSGIFYRQACWLD